MKNDINLETIDVEKMVADIQAFKEKLAVDIRSCVDEIGFNKLVKYGLPQKTLANCMSSPQKVSLKMFKHVLTSLQIINIELDPVREFKKK
jgi:isopenicillin N synthase-like dioxygenase